MVRNKFTLSSTRKTWRGCVKLNTRSGLTETFAVAKVLVWEII